MADVHPVLIYTAILIGFVVTTLVMAHVTGPRRRTAVKEMPYESGMDPIGDARQPFDVKFYLVAILFLVFDVELLFLYPWAVSAYADGTGLRDAAGPTLDAAAALPGSALGGGIPVELRGTVFGVMLVFFATLAIAYVYAWRKGVFRWR